MGKNWSGNNRASWHDYTARQIYHITLKKREGVMNFGKLAGDWRIKPGISGSSYILSSPLGRAIKECLKDIACIHPALRVYQYALMPDHVHIILSVEETLDEILGRKLAAFKVMVNKRANIERVFDKGFNDQILTASRKLDPIFTYLRENPYRLAVRFANPQFFERVNRISIGGEVYSAYGNFQLLVNPFKEQVVIHRADNAVKKKSDHDVWIHSAANGGVLVSPFISSAEKLIRAEAEEAGGKVILITHQAFPERFKPAAHDFALCAQGRLLIISLGLSPQTALTRSICLRMNELAQTITLLTSRSSLSRQQ